MPSYKKQDFYILAHRYRFSPQELIQYLNRFNRMAQGDAFNLRAFRDTMGLLGLQSTRIIADRIFSVMDKDNKGKVTFEEFLAYMDVLIHGKSEEKAMQSFRLIAQRGKDVITYEDFATWLISVWKMYNALTGSEVSTSDSVIREYFCAIDIKQDGVIDFEEYKKSMKRNKQLFEFFDFVNKGIAEKLNPVSAEEDEKHPFVQKLDFVENQINNCLQLLNAKTSPRTLLSPRPDQLEPEDIEIDLESIASMGDSILEDDHWLDNCKFLGENNEFQAKGLPGHTKVQEVVQTEEPPKNNLEVIGMLQELLNKIHSLRNGVNENDEETLMRMRSSTKYNVPKHQPEKKKGTIQWGDEDWNLILNMMLGIQKSVRAASADLDFSIPPKEEEFRDKAKHNLLPGQVHLQRKICKFRDYAPAVFERIRRMHGIAPSTYTRSLGVEKIMSSLLKSEFSSLVGLLSSGKSGSFFYYSDDGQYVLKTMSKEEYSFLRKLLPNYYSHLVDNPDSLIPRFFGFHKIMYHKGKELVKKHFIVMSNVFGNCYEVHLRYDLKGSTYGRETDPSEDPSVARKDLDFNRSGMKIKLGHERSLKFLDILKRDSEFFAENKIIDYSLLLGIHNLKGKGFVRNENVRWSETDGGGVVSEDGRELYLMGVIDILTHYTSRKKMEHLIKKSLHGSENISCIPPRPYADRFYNYISSIVE